MYLIRSFLEYGDKYNSKKRSGILSSGLSFFSQDLSYSDFSSIRDKDIKQSFKL